ncbi:MAG: ABC transporter ATP-binding protein, partial [Desulfuromonadales bacterium]|nr:ABC transporter ATP-binding protein [Desulfuromonadales bacterium]
VAVIVSGKLQTVNIVSDLLDTGVVGYVVHVADCPETILKGFETKECSSGISEIFVPCNDLNHFMALIAAESARVQLIEPKRRDLEQFFLDIVKRGSG